MKPATGAICHARSMSVTKTSWSIESLSSTIHHVSTPWLIEIWLTSSNILGISVLFKIRLRVLNRRKVVVVAPGNLTPPYLPRKKSRVQLPPVSGSHAVGSLMESKAYIKGLTQHVICHMFKRLPIDKDMKGRRWCATTCRSQMSNPPT